MFEWSNGLRCWLVVANYITCNNFGYLGIFQLQELYIVLNKIPIDALCVG
jgi:hypothetical protein